MHYGFVYTSICEEMCDVWYGLSLGRGVEQRMARFGSGTWWKLEWKCELGWCDGEGWLWWDGGERVGCGMVRQPGALWKGGSVADGAAGGGGDEGDIWPRLKGGDVT